MQEKKATKIVLTGGHAATTALSVIEELIREKGWEIYWVGSEVAVEGKNIPTLESKIFPQIGVKTFGLTAGRLQRRFTRWTIFSLLKIPLGFFQAFFLIIKIRPQVILSFGGYAGFPVVLSGWFLGIPVVVHEQTCAAGRANRASAFFARKIALARGQSKQYFPGGKCIVTGNPLMTGIRDILPKEKPGVPHSIFITGGSRGAQRLNSIVGEILPQLLSRYKVTHLTGPLDWEKFHGISEKLPGNLKKNYEVYPEVNPMEVDNLYRESDLIIGRAGANTVSEIMYIKRPAILVPIPWSYLNEQTKNAESAEQFGIAKVLTEDKLTCNALQKEIETMFKNWKAMVSLVKNKPSPDREAAGKVVQLIHECF